MFKFYLYKIGQHIVNWLPLPWAYKFGLFFSDLQYYFSPRDRRAVKNNLRAITGSDKDISKRAKEVFRNFGRYLVEFFCMVKMVDEKFIKEMVTVTNIGRLKEALTHGKGAIIMTAHIGNWELGGIVMSSLGYPSVAIALPHKERPVNDLFNRQRESRGLTIVPSNNAVRKCVETLKQNKIIALLADRDFTEHGEILPFLGKKALIPRGAAIFSTKTGAPIVPMFLTRDGDGRFSLNVEEPIWPQQVIEEYIENDHMVTLMKKYVDVIEKKVRQYPSQWLMFRQFWVNEK